MSSNRAFNVVILASILLFGRSAAADPAIAFAVKRSHAVGSSAGTLRFTTLGVEYVTNAKSETRRWTYSDIKQLQIVSPTRITVITYEDQGWLRLGADRRFDFELREGTISAETVGFIVAHTERPVLSAVLPALPESPLFRVPVKHERHGRGSDGVLLMYDEALVYRTERAEATRYWRFSDIFAVLPLDLDRLQVLVYEGGPGELRPYTFQLKAEMPSAFARALWARVNPPAPFVIPSTNGERVVGGLNLSR